MRELRAVARLAGLSWWRFGVCVLLGCVTVLCGAALLGVAGYLIGRAAQRPPILSLGVLGVTVRALAIARPIARYGERLAGHDLAFRSLGRLRCRIFAAVEPLAPAGLTAFRDGELVDRLVADVDALQDLILRVALPVAVAVPTALIVVAAFAVVEPSAAVVLAVGLVVTAVVPSGVAAAVAARARGRQAALRAALSTDLVESFTAAEELWLAGADTATAQRLIAEDAALAAVARRDAAGAGLGDALGVLTTGATMLGVLVVAAAAVAAGRLGELFAIPLVLVTVGAFEAVLPLSVAARQVPAVRASARRLLEVVATPPEVVDPDVVAPAPATRPGIELDAVRVSRGRGADRRVVAADVALSLPAGGRLVLDGPSGGGKTSIASLLVRFLERDAGTATLDGTDLRAYAADDVRHAVLLSEQEPHLFDSDLRANVAFARPGCDDDAIRAALAAARLDDWVASLPEGLDTRVGMHGRALSAGQRQRVALARAFLAAPGVLILDEPTAHLDLPTAAALLADVWDGAGDRGVVLVTHLDPGPFADAVTVHVPAHPGGRR